MIWPVFAAAVALAAALGLSVQAAQPAESTAGSDIITFEQYRDWRLAFTERRRDELASQLAAADLAAERKTRLEQTKSYYDWLAGLSDADRDRRFRERFARIDANRDGQLDPAERAAWRDKQRAFYNRDRPARQQHVRDEAR